ncbi:helix-turn-helix domain-containing protein [Paenibacillus sp. TRM 82003]|nr:helix-turn-helix domain-containing protein [Paenibacillus sp. TRM 82003]
MYKALLVSPDDHSVEEVQRMLDWERCDFALEGYAGTPEEALSLIDTHCYSLILIQINKLREEWMTLCEQIRKSSRVPIILFGGPNDFQLARKALTVQANDYIPAPVMSEEMVKSLRLMKQVLDSEGPLDEFTDKKELSERSPVIDTVKKFVEQELDKNITLKKISSILHFNCSYLSQKFKSHENMTFNEYLLQQRMERAKALLENTNMKVYEIANKVGYTEMDWFYKKFKEYTGVSANEYRKTSSITA